jgi:hypothetical protein
MLGEVARGGGGCVCDATGLRVFADVASGATDLALAVGARAVVEMFTWNELGALAVASRVVGAKVQAVPVGGADAHAHFRVTGPVKPFMD